MNPDRIKVYLPIILYGHIFNWPWRPHLLRRQIRGEITQDAVCRYLDRYVSPCYHDEAGSKRCVRPVQGSAGEERQYTTEKAECRTTPETGPATPASGHATTPDRERIFTIWLQGEDNAPAIVRACLRSIRHNCRQELTVIDERSLQDWIILPDYIMEKWKAGKIRAAHFADICRVELLYRYGGIWMDATCFATSPVPQQITDEDFFIYLSGSRLKGMYSFVQNCFFRAKKGNYLLGAWRDSIFRYWAAEDSIIDYFAHQLLFKVTVGKNPDARRLFEGMPHIVQDPTHTVWEEYRDRPFDRETFDRLTAGAFFQKTEYKSDSARHPVPGSFSETMQNMYTE